MTAPDPAAASEPGAVAASAHLAKVDAANSDWIEVSVEALPGDADLIAEVLGRFAPGMVAIEPALRTSDIRDFAYELPPDAPGVVRAYLSAPLDREQRRAIDEALAALPLARPIAARYAAVEERDWSTEWRRYFHTLHVGERIVVTPSWECYEAVEGELVIELDPGAAFGTGQHPTTRLCLAALEQTVWPGARVLDVGTGSGILAIAAARLGATEVVAVDVDESVLEVARENVVRSGVENRVRLAGGSLDDVSDIARFEVVVMNISSAAVRELLPGAASSLSPGGMLIASGFIAEAAADIEALAEGLGLSRLALTADEEWRCLVAGASQD